MGFVAVSLAARRRRRQYDGSVCIWKVAIGDETVTGRTIIIGVNKLGAARLKRSAPISRCRTVVVVVRVVHPARVVGVGVEKHAQ